jgi:hypothetical protein
MRKILVAIFLFNSLIASVSHAPFIVVTPQKTGTHLLTKALSCLLQKPVLHEWQGDLPREEIEAFLERANQMGAYPHMHALARPNVIQTFKEKGYRVLFLMRDPRDQLISLYFFIQGGWIYGPLRETPPYSDLTELEKLDELITGRRFGVSGTLAIVGRRVPWMYESSNFVQTLRFENLVGEEGGGSREAQILELERAMAFISADISKKKIRKRSRHIFGRPGEVTFRKGQIGDWKNYFTPELKVAFKEIFGNELIYLGYEPDLNW